MRTQITQISKIAMTFWGLLVLPMMAAAETAKDEDNTNGFQDSPEAQAFIERVVTTHDFDRAWVTDVIHQAQRKQAILDAIARPAEKTKPWYEYREIFLGDERIDQGVAFWQENAEALAAAEQQFGVDAAVIVAILGVETRYGRYMGSYRVVDALATLGFDYPPRSAFFARELEQFLMLAREQQQDPLTLMGSYAGAMGFGQFMPSSYRAYALDNDDDGFADIWNNRVDAIASIANYLKAHGWQTDKPVLVRAHVPENFDESMLYKGKRPEQTVADWAKHGVVPQTPVSSALAAVPLAYEMPDGDAYWLGFNNFYVITRYNRSHLYAMAVWQLSQAIDKRKNDKAEAET